MRSGGPRNNRENKSMKRLTILTRYEDVKKNREKWH